MGLIFNNTTTDTFINSGSTMQDGVVTINKYLHFQVPDNENPRNYTDIDVWSHPNFPQYGSALSNDARYKFYGSASVTRDNPDSRFFHAQLQYSTTNANASDSGGNPVTSETKPWDLKPDNISFSFPEKVIPFTASFGKGNRLYKKLSNGSYVANYPVANSVGDPIIDDTSVHDINMSFTYATEKWKISDSLYYGNSINSQSLYVLGVYLPAGTALLLFPEPTYITVYEDNSTRIKWQYWSININIQVDKSEQLLERKLSNIGNRAYFNSFEYTDDLIGTTIQVPASKNNSILIPENIITFRKPKKEGSKCFPLGDRVFCGFQQFLYIRSKILEKDASYDIQYEQLENMPLTTEKDSIGKGFLDIPAITVGNERFGQYQKLTFRKYPYLDWSALNLPKKGIEW